MRYVVECFNDQCLLEAYGIDPSYDINHKYSQGKSAVFEALSKQKKRIGMVDFDKGIEDEYFDKFQFVIRISSEIDVYFEEDNENYLIVFKKKIETMFVQETKKTNTISTAQKLGFNNSEGNYHGIQSDFDKLNKLKNLLTTLIKRSDKLKKLREYLFN